MQPCIHIGKTKCTYCTELFGKPVDWYITERYRAQTVGEVGALEKYYALKAKVEQDAAGARF